MLSEPLKRTHITHNAEVKNEDGSVKSEENISVELPESVKFDYANRIIITVSNKADNTAVKDMTVVTSEFVIEGTETKSLTGITDKDGIIILPPSNEGVTDKDGKTDISETIPARIPMVTARKIPKNQKRNTTLTLRIPKEKLKIRISK